MVSATLLNISTVLPELTSKQKTGREIKTITSSNLRSRWTKRGGSDCTICPMGDERDSERARFHHAGQSKSTQMCVFTAASQMFLIESNWQFSVFLVLLWDRRDGHRGSRRTKLLLISSDLLKC